MGESTSTSTTGVYTGGREVILTCTPIFMCVVCGGGFLCALLRALGLLSGG